MKGSEIAVALTERMDSQARLQAVHCLSQGDIYPALRRSSPVVLLERMRAVKKAGEQRKTLGA